MNEYPSPYHVSEYGSEYLIPSTVKLTHQKGNINQVIHFNSLKYPTEINLDASIVASQIVEEKDMPSITS